VGSPGQDLDVLRAGAEQTDGGSTSLPPRHSLTATTPAAAASDFGRSIEAIGDVLAGCSDRPLAITSGLVDQLRAGLLPKQTAPSRSSAPVEPVSEVNSERAALALAKTGACAR
jgi:hypothetical protein